MSPECDGTGRIDLTHSRFDTHATRRECTPKWGVVWENGGWMQRSPGPVRVQGFKSTPTEPVKAKSGVNLDMRIHTYAATMHDATRGSL